MYTRKEAERAVVELFKICHWDLDPVAIEKEIDARMARQAEKLAAQASKPKKAEPDLLTGYRLKSKYRHRTNPRVETEE